MDLDSKVTFVNKNLKTYLLELEKVENEVLIANREYEV